MGGPAPISKGDEGMSPEELAAERQFLEDHSVTQLQKEESSMHARYKTQVLPPETHADIKTAIEKLTPHSGDYLPAEFVTELRSIIDTSTLQKKDTMTSSTPTPARIAAAEALVELRKYEDDLPIELIHELTKAAAGTSENDDAADIGANVARLAKAEDEVKKDASRENLRQQVHKARQAMEARYLEQVSPSAARNAQIRKEHNEGRRDF